MAGLKIKKGDRVRVLTGKDRGKEGEVMRAIPDDGKVIVDGVNVAKKHQRATSATMQGGIIDKDMPIPVANVAIVCPAAASPPASATASTPTATRSASARSAEVRCRERQPPRPSRSPASRCSTTTEIRAQLKDDPRPRQHHAGPAAREDRAQHGRRRGRSASRRSSRAPCSDLDHASPARSRSSPRPRSRSPASSSARATPSAPRSPCAATACGSSSTG